MKRTRSHVLEDESKQALKSFLPIEWIIRKKDPDYGIDFEVEIVEGEELTNKHLWLQLKATESIKSRQKSISYQMQTNHMKYYENCPIPVLILFWIKSENTFFYLFAQRYIKEQLTIKRPNWREQKKVKIKFPRNSKLDNIDELNSIAIIGRLYLIQQHLNIKPEGAQYWLDGIPKSDNKELKERTLIAFSYLEEENYSAAIVEFENILRVCSVSPTEKMSILLNLGNAQYSLSKNDDALKNYHAILDLTKKVDRKNAFDGKSAALGNIGLIYIVKSEWSTALNYYKKALEEAREIDNKQAEATHLGNIGYIHRMKGELENAMKYITEALEIHKIIRFKEGIAIHLGNIGLIYYVKGEQENALQHFQKSLTIAKEINYKRGVSAQLGNIGLINRVKGELDLALKNLNEALRIAESISDKQLEASQLCNIGLINRIKGALDKALKCHKDALKINREIGNKEGEATQLGNIGLIHSERGDFDSALEYYQDSLKIHNKIGCKVGESVQLGNIGLIYQVRGDLDSALKYLNDARELAQEIGYKQGEATHLGNIGLIYKVRGDFDETF